MNKKICHWLDSNLYGGLLLIDGDKCSACCVKGFNLFKNNRRIKFKDIDIEELKQARIELFNDINNNIRHECDNCEYLIVKDEKDININNLSFLSIANFKTCNLRCKYCYYSDKELGSKLEEEDRYIFPILKKFHENNMLKKEGFCLGLAGGEPLLINDIVETAKFIKDNYPNSIINVQSNSTLTMAVENIAYEFKKLDGIYKTLYTSIDAGTEENYKKIRGVNLFNRLKNNLILYAENSSFDEIMLKYILLEDKEKELNNLSEKDIIGFCQIVQLIKSKNKNKTIVVLDKDLRTNGTKISDDMLDAAGKIYYICKELLDVDINFIGGGLITNSKIEIENIERIKNYSNFNKNKYIYIFDINVKRKKLVNKIAWWIPVKKWRDNFRNKMLNTDQTRPDQTRPDLICKEYIYDGSNIIIINNKLQVMLQYDIAA
ncbi:radical SAM protein [Brachyspira intermedia]|uniref:radical SAM protein n=1 Tax=Brachyspira intermedia TaxID=84377 RepID=UPI0030065360